VIKIIVLLLIGYSSQAATILGGAGANRFVVSGGGCTIASGNKFNESFEGTGYEGSWTEGSGTPDEDAALPGTSPCSGLGSQCVAFNRIGATKLWTRHDGGEGSVSTIRYFRCYVYVTSHSLASTDYTEFMGAGDNTDPSGVNNPAFSVVFYNNGGTLEMRVRHNGSYVLGGGIGISTATWYRFEISYQPSTASGLVWKLFNASTGSQVGTTQTISGSTSALNHTYYYLGTGDSDNNQAINISVDGFGVSSTGFLGQ
jgi:hypothetical protein